ncbi:adenosine deaminase [Rudaeicoccus suwonensis]|uniref:Adenine deaminase n=1 Tax=Rudaeicoccus suwonensis TaxID=657409 RepID=A0A561E1F5_9MICO|nr:adenosine deaminase [Rudaeicoccus suwonensis]TWE09420.1 adenosine deaminase [Rudaeicoccus suwonensis]
MIDTIRALPKAELHLHIEGTLEPDLVFALARRNGVQLPFADVAALSRAYNFSDLQSFLNLYYDCMAVLQHAADFEDLANAYLARAAADGVTHVEMFFDPQAHTSRGIPLAEVIAGLTAAITTAPTRHGVHVRLIACFLRDRPADEAMTTLEALSDHLDIVDGVGLDSAEVGHPPTKFKDVFAEAATLGLHRVAHAGEEGPPAYIWEALDVLGVERVDHGIRAVEDPALLRRLATDKVPLTVCPLSNVRLKCVATLKDHPLHQLLDAGVIATINSDDPAYFGGYLADNYLALHRELGTDLTTLQTLAQNSLDARFHPKGS